MANFCTQCGAQNSLDAKFCGDCGAGLQVQAQVATAQTPAAPPSSSVVGAGDQASLRGYLLACYGLMIAGWLSFGLLSIVAVVIAYVKRGDSDGTWCQSHFPWLIKTFWVGFIISIVGVVTMIIGIGFVVLVVGFIWTLYRIVMGLIRVIDSRAVGT